MNVGTEDILKLKAGTIITINCTDWRKAESIKQLAYRAAKINPDGNVRYRCSLDYKKPAITIEVIEVKKSKR